MFILYTEKKINKNLFVKNIFFYNEIYFTKMYFVYNLTNIEENLNM